MTTKSELYHRLLGIPPAEQPPNHYRLLGIPVFEEDKEVISHAAARQMRYVRDMAGSQFAELVQELLNELSVAKVCLLSAEKRKRYDAQLRERLAQRDKSPTLPDLKPAPRVDTMTRHGSAPASPAARRWQVGSSPDCDIIIEAETVSRRHCVLIQSDDGLILEDCESTNGTFVNGAQLKRRIELLPGDWVTLGKSTHLELPADVRFSVAREHVVLIGRDRANDVVLEHPAVSSRHARILLVKGRIVLEDLGSTNGTAVGDPSNLIVKTSISLDEKVFFGDLAVQASDLIDRPGLTRNDQGFIRGAQRRRSKHLAMGKVATAVR